MDAHWVASSVGLPHNGQPVQFVLDDREVAMEGVYERRSFRSRWTGYEVDRVRSWRLVNESAEAASAF